MEREGTWSASRGCSGDRVRSCYASESQQSSGDSGAAACENDEDEESRENGEAIARPAIGPGQTARLLSRRRAKSLLGSLALRHRAKRDTLDDARPGHGPPSGQWSRLVSTSRPYANQLPISRTPDHLLSSTVNNCASFQPRNGESLFPSLFHCLVSGIITGTLTVFPMLL